MPVTIVIYHCISICFLSVVITKSRQVIPSAVAQHIIIKFITNENVRPETQSTV